MTRWEDWWGHDIGARPREEICFFLFDFMALFLLFRRGSCAASDDGEGMVSGEASVC